MMKKKIYLQLNNHFDPMWRRCFRRSFESGGESYVSYADIEEYYLLDHLALAVENPDYAFEIESILVLREFLRRHPERLPELQKLCKEGRFYISGAGDNIIDTNLVLGESIIRNYLYGHNEIEELFGYRPRVANRMDAFGNSAQLPQILNNFGMFYIDAISYTLCRTPIWRGLDGSQVTQLLVPSVGSGGHYAKYPPCPACKGRKQVNGKPCPACEGRGIDRKADRNWLPIQVDEAALERWGVGKVAAGNEELLPNPDTLQWAEKAKEQYEVTFCNREAMIEDTECILQKRQESGEQLCSKEVELNPNNSGCWVSRIETKLTCRRQEHALLAAEGASVLAFLKNSVYPDAEIRETWRNLLFTMFHDAITGTHIDAAYEELRDIWAQIDGQTRAVADRAIEVFHADTKNCFFVLNSSGVQMKQAVEVSLPTVKGMIFLRDEDGKVVACAVRKREADQTVLAVPLTVSPYQVRCFRWEEMPETGLQSESAEQPVIENERYRILADEHGVVSVYDKKLCMELFTEGSRPFELVLEHDEGSPWATLSPDRRQRGLSEYAHLAECRKEEAGQTLRFVTENVDSYGLSALSAVTEITLWKDFDRIDLAIHTEWDDYQHRLKVSFPLALEKSRHFYEIPGGVLQREEYEPEYGWASANGDWPAVHWAGAWGDTFAAVCFNHGTPCYTMEQQTGGTLLAISLLRSPCIPTYLHEPASYTMRDWDGMRDSGSHDFRLEFESFLPDITVQAVAEKALSGAITPICGLGTLSGLPEMPTLQGGGLITAAKRSENGRYIVLRICNYSDDEIQSALKLPKWVVRVGVSGMDEKEPEMYGADGSYTIRMAPWQILTCCLEPRNDSIE